MSFQERKRKVLNLFEDFEELSVLEISQKLSISPATVRRDLKDLDTEGLIVRTHGGAMRPQNQNFTAFHQKQQVHDEKKQQIAELAAKQISPGDILFLDCGSTVFAMCSYLKKIRPLKIITNSLPVAAELMTIPEISINLVGGELDKARKAIHGHIAVQHIQQYSALKAFIGTDGFSIHKGLSSHSESEASITAAFCAHAEMVYLLCDASKIGKDTYLQSVPVSGINYLITDNCSDPVLQKALSENNVILLSAKSL